MRANGVGGTNSQTTDGRAWPIALEGSVAPLPAPARDHFSPAHLYERTREAYQGLEPQHRFLANVAAIDASAVSAIGLSLLFGAPEVGAAALAVLITGVVAPVVGYLTAR